MSFFPYVGGKAKLAKTIIEKFPEHRCYVEVFAGAANIFLRKEPSKVEVINDINKEIITLYRVVQNHLEEFVRYFKWALVSRDEFYRQRKVFPDTLTDIQRAVRFYYVQKSCFAGRVDSPSFGYSKTVPPRFNLLRVEEELSSVHLRLARAVIECLPYGDILERYDTPDTLFYLDPPYEGVEHYYGRGTFSKADYPALADILQKMKGRFILSIKDSPYIRDAFAGFKMEEVPITYTAARDAGKAGAELIITNF